MNVLREVKILAIVQFNAEEMFETAADPTDVPVPIGSPVSRVRSHGVPSKVSSSKSGVWECTPGRWVREVKQAEFCHFISGNATFSPDEGEPITINVGDCVYFPANSTGVWEIKEDTRKIFIVFDEVSSR